MLLLKKVISFEIDKKKKLAFLLNEPIVVGAINAYPNIDVNTKTPPLEIPKTIFDFPANNSLDMWDRGFNWPGNISDMQMDNIDIKDSILNLNINKETNIVDGQTYNYSGAEIQSKATYNGGEFDFLIKNGAKPGTVGSAFLTSPWKEGNWYQKEIDIEFLGDKPNGVQFNFHSIHHGPNGKLINDISGEPYKKFVELDFDTTKEFHKYSIKYDPLKKYIHFFVDGQEKYRIDNCDLVSNQDMEIRLNHWVPDNKPGWVGDVNNDPTSSDYVENSTMQYKKIEVKTLEDINRTNIINEISVIDSSVAIANSVAVFSLFSLAGSFAAPFLGLLFRKAFYSVVNFGRFIFGKKPLNNKVQYKMPSAKHFGIAGGVSAAIACGVKGGLVGSAFGPLGITVGALAGTLAGSIAGFLGGFSGGFIVNKLIDKFGKNKCFL